MEIIVFISIVIIDQFTKVWVNRALALGGSVPVWEGVFHITNVHNTGAAWGMLSGGRILFLIFTPIFCGLLIWFFIKKRSRVNVFGRLCLTLLVAGAVGNFIDRIALSYVRDMFDFCLIRFPVFNVADSAITIGACMLVFDTLFHKGNSLMDMLDRDKADSAPAAEENNSEEKDNDRKDTEQMDTKEQIQPDENAISADQDKDPTSEDVIALKNTQENIKKDLPHTSQIDPT